MKIVEIAFALLVFNIAMSMVSHSGIVDNTAYYESNIVNEFGEDGGLPDNITTVSESQQYTTSMNIFNVIISVVSFDWIYYLIPDELDIYFVPFVLGLDSVMAFLMGLAIIEIFIRREETLGSGK